MSSRSPLVRSQGVPCGTRFEIRFKKRAESYPIDRFADDVTESNEGVVTASEDAVKFKMPFYVGGINPNATKAKKNVGKVPKSDFFRIETEKLVKRFENQEKVK